MSNIGTIVQVIGPVVDVDFSASGKLPEIYNALEIKLDFQGKSGRLVCEVQSHMGDGWVRSVAMTSTDGLRRGMSATDTGAPITVPVGEEVLGRIFNVTGDPVDDQAAPNVVKRYPIHRPAPKLADQDPSAQILETGITKEVLPAKMLNFVSSGAAVSGSGLSADDRGKSLRAFLRAKEKEYLTQVLASMGGDKEKTAKALKVSLATLYRKLPEPPE